MKGTERDEQGYPSRFIPQMPTMAEAGPGLLCGWPRLMYVSHYYGLPGYALGSWNLE